MRSAWQFPSAIGHAGVPVEMRFIDLFMAAVGALLFMAMMLAFLLRFLHTSEPHPFSGEIETPFQAEPLQIVTQTLPPARIGEPYAFAFAYRGGSGPIHWAIIAGAAELPHGLIFDPSSGLLSGRPATRADARFVLQAADGHRDQNQRPFELLVQEATGKGSRRLELSFAAAVLLIFLFVWLGSLSVIKSYGHNILVLEKAWAGGQTSITWKKGEIERETIVLPQGIGLYKARLQSARRFGRMALLVLLLLVTWFVWRIRGG